MYLGVLQNLFAHTEIVDDPQIELEQDHVVYFYGYIKIYIYMHKSPYTKNPSNTLAYQDTTVTIVLFWTQFLQGFMNPQSRPIGRKA